MRIKSKDLELVVEHIKKNLCESVDIQFDSDEKGLNVFSVNFTDIEKKLSKIIVFDANIGATPDLIAKRKLYKT